MKNLKYLLTAFVTCNNLLLEYMDVITVACRKLENLEREISRDVFEKITEICRKSNLDILDSNYDKTHRIGQVSESKSLFVKHLSVIQ